MTTDNTQELDELLARHNGELGVTWEDPDVVTPDTKQAIRTLIEEADIKTLETIAALLSNDDENRMQVVEGYIRNKLEMYSQRGQSNE